MAFIANIIHSDKKVMKLLR